jgi:hypothetical protein
MNSILIDALDNYYKIKKDSEKYNFKITNEIYNLEYLVYMEYNKNIIKKNYNIICIIDKNKNSEIFYWGWYLNFSNIYINRIKKLMLYAIEFDISRLSDIYIKKKLLNSHFIIENFIQSIELIALAVFLTKACNIYIIDNNNYTIIYGIYD